MKGYQTMNKALPVGKAQGIILQALGRTDIQSWQEAEAFFARIGIVVNAKRVGRTSVPVVRLKETMAGGFNEYGEGEVYEIDYETADLSKIEQWIAK
jgi:L-asparaginase/Glu-tRNA(Gln) amidotransferase subunit D